LAASQNRKTCKFISVVVETRDRLGQEMTEITRRVVICCASMFAIAESAETAGAVPTARDLPPQIGDYLVVSDATGGNANAPIKLADLKPGDDPTLAWSFDPKQKLARDASRLNQVLLMRFDPASLGETEKKYTAGGAVAFSAICTHQGCTVTDWLKSKQVLQCPCHQSEYDPRHAAKVVAGPAPRPLPALPLKLSGDILVVAGEFTDRVGGETQGNQ
jgi:rieske iron-sulfur protein